MEKWTDKRIKQHVDEVIEESYLLSLRDTEIQQYLRDFIETCECILRDTVQKGRDIKVTGIRISLLKAHLLLSVDIYSPQKNQDGHAIDKSVHNLLAEQVVVTKSLILRLIDEYDSKLAEAVLEGNREKGALFRERRIRKARFLSLLVQSGYFALLVLTGFIMWVVLFN